MDPQCPQPIVVNRCGDCSWAHECLRQEAQQQETARAGEEKDPTWAYSTEQLLGEYLAASVARGKLQITGVDCRTTYCEVNATSADARSPEQLAKPIMDALAQGGLDLSPNMATDVGYDDGVWKLHSIISRKSKEASR
jgi:hypothetical protein